MNTHGMTRALGALALMAGLAGCSDSLDVAGSGTTRVLLQRASDNSSFPSSPQGAPGATRSVSPDTVQSLMVTVTAVEFLRAGSDGNGSGWTAMQFHAPVQVNLMALSTNPDSAYLLAAGHAAAGAYTRVRLVVSNPRIRFRGAVDFGSAGTVQGNTDYALQLGANGSSSIEANLSLSLDISGSADASSDTRLEFDAGSTMASLSLMGSGAVMISPVLYQK